MQRIAAGLLVALAITGCRPSDARPDAGGATRAGLGNVRPGQVTARLEQLLWDQRAPAYIRSDLWHVVRTTYDRRQYQPYWVGAGAPERAAALVTAVCRAESEGLRSADYHIERLAAELEGLRRSRSSDRLGELDLMLTGVLFAYGEDLLLGSVDPESVAPEWNAGAPPAVAERLLQRMLAGTVPFDSALTALRPRSAAYDALIAELEPLRAAEAAGGWAEIPDDQLLRRGGSGPAVDALRRRLAATGELPAADTTPGRAFDRALAEAVARFQARHGLDADGVAGKATLAALNVPAAHRIAQVEANLERYRWIPENLVRAYALYDVPAGQLSVEGGDSTLRSAARMSEALRYTLPPVVADTIARVVVDASAEGPERVLMTLTHQRDLHLRGSDRVADSATAAGADSEAIVVERPLDLAALAVARSPRELREAASAEVGGRLELRGAVPIFLLDPSVRRDGDTMRFEAAVSARDRAIARALGPAQPQPPERCEALGLAAASAVLSGR